MINIENKTIEILKNYLNIPEDVTRALFDLGFLEEHNCKRIIIIEEYKEKCIESKKTDLKLHLADKFALSFSTIEKYVKNL